MPYRIEKFDGVGSAYDLGKHKSVLTLPYRWSFAFRHLPHTRTDDIWSYRAWRARRSAGVGRMYDVCATISSCSLFTQAGREKSSRSVMSS